jgi:protein involved in polysaccharide export with SLBB domain
MVFVPEKAEEEKPFTVNILGQIEKPGAYPMTKESRLFDALYQAGGFAGEAAIDKVTVIHIGVDSLVKEEFNVEEFLRSGDQKLNPLVIKGDTIYVPLSQDAKEIPPVHEAFLSSMRVSVIGEVTKPNTFQVSKNISLLDILKLAGGPTSQADLKKVAVISEIADSDGKENSQTVNLQKVLTKGEFQLLPKLNTGDTIFVPRKTERNLWGNIMKTISNISTIIVTYYLIIGLHW